MILETFVTRTLSTLFPHAVAWFNKPKLLIDFGGGDANIVPTEHEEGGKPGAFIYVRARVRNVGRHGAKECRVFLKTLEEVLSNGKTLQTAWNDSKPLAWAGGGFAPVDVPAGVEFYVDVVRISKNDCRWSFSVEKLFASQQNLRDFAGTYRLHLIATADNAAPGFCTVDVVYNGNWHSLRALEVKPD